MTTESEIQLLRLIAAEQYAEFDSELRACIASVDMRSPESVRQVAEFLGSALLDAKTRRAHYGPAMEELQAARSYNGPRPVAGDLDVVG